MPSPRSKVRCWKNYLWLLLLSCAFSLSAQQFSDSVRISLITGSPGKDLYAQFGHSAIRVVDYKYNRDLLFNYGTFDFDTPNFYWNFVKGKLFYKLSINYTEDYIRSYKRDGRSLIDQELQLTAAEQQQILKFLVNNYRPENRTYLYDFYYDNCVTRIRDIFEQEIKGFNYLQADIDTFTFRQALDIYVQQTPWIDFGMDLILGMPNERPAGLREQMFLPEYAADYLTTYARNGDVPLLGAPTILTPLEESKARIEAHPITPFLVTISLLLIGLMVTLLPAQGLRLWFDRIFFLVVGLAGTFLLFAWLGTDHFTTKYNWNVLWLNPLLVFLPFVLKKRGTFTKALLIIGAAANLIALVGWSIIPQQFHWAFVPLMLLILLRCSHRLWKG